MMTMVSKSTNPFFLSPPYRVNRHEDVIKLGAVSQCIAKSMEPAAVFAVRSSFGTR
jgi:hypothetical protein